MTLVPDGAYRPIYYLILCLTFYLSADFADSQLKSLIGELASANFDPYLTSVGGSGLGILSPHGRKSLNDENPADGPITPPETPSDQADGPLSTKSLRDHFVSVNTEDLNQWADARGRWMFV